MISGGVGYPVEDKLPGGIEHALFSGIGGYTALCTQHHYEVTGFHRPLRMHKVAGS